MIKHILKDGTVLNDITGHVVKKKDAPTAYTLLDSINSDRNERRTKENDGNL